MKQIPIYQVDAFAAGPFSGNPAAICPLNEWLDDELMQHIAMENNLAETAFFIPKEDGVYGLRWFTPTTEVDLCGHATLATAHVLFNHLEYEGNEVCFDTHSGELRVGKAEQGDYVMDFPIDKPFPTTLKKQEEAALFNGLDIEPTQVYRGITDLMVVLESEEDVKTLSPEFRILKDLDARGIIVTAPGSTVDFVSRFFAPQAGIDEDPVTGSTHTTLTPFWAERLGKVEMDALQLSVRGGELKCTLEEDRVKLQGQAFTVMEGKFYIYW